MNRYHQIYNTPLLYSFINHMTILLIFATLLLSFISCDYSEILGQKLCRLTIASYCKKSQIQKWSCLPCKHSPLLMQNIKIFTNSSKDTLGYMGTNEQLSAIILAFRGTLPWDIKNDISDMDMTSTDFPLCSSGCKVHRGFYQAFLDIQNQVLTNMVQYRIKYPQFNKIIVTGHSLGASLATHAVAILMANRYKVDQFYTFGSFRVGDKDFTNWFNKMFSTYGGFKGRVTHRRDPVPHMPIYEAGYTHINSQYFYKGDKKDGFQKCLDDENQDKNCSDRYMMDLDVFDHVSYYDIHFDQIIAACQV